MWVRAVAVVLMTKRSLTQLAQELLADVLLGAGQGQRADEGGRGRLRGHICENGGRRSLNL